MSALEEYIRKVKLETKGFTELEKIRYVYLDLGKRFSFDLKYAFGNGRAKEKIYRESGKTSVQNKALEDNIIICKSLAYILQYVYGELGIKASVDIDFDDQRKQKHVYNIISQNDGKRYRIDLQEDLENIQANDRTRYFGIGVIDNQDILISRKELEDIDLKLGYIRKDYYYSGDYMYLLSSTTDMMSDPREKAKFILENLEPYKNPNRRYAERKWKHERILKKLYTNNAKNPIKLIDTYRENENGDRAYELYAAVECKQNVDIYRFSEEDGYTQIEFENFVEQVDNGLVCLDSVPGLKQYLRKRRLESDGR